MMIDLHSHPSEEVLEHYSLGHLSEAEWERVDEHLFVCHQCQDGLAQVEKFAIEMKIACHEYRLRTDSARPTIFARISALLAVPRLAYGGALAGLLLAFAVPSLIRNQADQTAPALVTWDMTYRGSDNTGVVSAPARRPLQLAIHATDLSAAGYRVQIVNQDGRTLWTGTPSREGDQLVVRPPKPLEAGMYWVRLFGTDPDPVREFGLRLN